MKAAATGAHADEDLLEEYLFQRLRTEDVASLEEHLLVCPECRVKLAETRDFVAHARAALKTMPAWQEDEDKHRESRRHRHFGFFPPVARPVWAITLAGAALVAISMPMLFDRRLDYQRTELATFRGAETKFAQIPASKAPELSFEREKLPVRDSYRIEVVTSSGTEVYSGPAATTPTEVTARIPKRLKPGKYWARVYSGAELLQESGFEVTR